MKEDKLVPKSDRGHNKSSVEELEGKFDVQINFYGDTPFADSD